MLEAVLLRCAAMPVYRADWSTATVSSIETVVCYSTKLSVCCAEAVLGETLLIGLLLETAVMLKLFDRNCSVCLTLFCKKL